jgi:Predicted integral membrane protein (DUF2269)
VTATDVVVLIHALTGIVFIVGLIGRWLILGAAARATDLPSMKTLTDAAGPFERIVVIGSLLVLLFGIVAAYLEGHSILGPLTGGSVDWLFVSVVLYLSIIPLVPLVFVPRGKVFGAALSDAAQQQRVTPELQAAWTDPVVRAAHIYELGAVTVVLILMLAQPF